MAKTNAATPPTGDTKSEIKGLYDTNNWSELVKIKRELLGESQGAFGKRFGVSHAAVSDWERKVSGPPGAVTWFLVFASPDDTEVFVKEPEPMKPLQPQSEIYKILEKFLDDMSAEDQQLERVEEYERIHAQTYAQIEALIEEEVTRRVVEALKKLDFSPEDEDNPGFSGTWHLDTYKLAIEDCRSDIKEAIRIAQLTQEKNHD